MLTLLGVLLLAVCASAFAGLREGSWEVNPAAFRYDMSLYFKLVDEEFENLDMYEIGAFVDDECRGLAEKLDLPDDGSCLFMRIRSNKADGESIDFLLRNKETGDTVILKKRDGSDFPFKSDSRVGLPSAPEMMARFFSVNVDVEGKGQVEFIDGLYEAGSMLDLFAIPDEGYHFESWSNGMTEDSFSVTVSDNFNITATFAPNIYKAVFKIGDEIVSELEVPCDSAIEAPETPVKVGYTFSGWGDLPETMPAHDIEVSGSFTINTYKLIFKIDGVTVEEGEVEYEAPVTAPDAEKEGYTFSGWGEVPATMPAHDVEIHGFYTINSYHLTFILDDVTILSEDVVYGSPIVAPEAPAREGYTFDGWSELPAAMPAKDLTITGDYSVNYYKLTFKVDGEELMSDSIAYGSKIETPEAPVKVGYTFNGWGELPETMPAHDVEMHSSYTLNYYKLSFTLDGVEIQSDSLIYGASIVAPEVKEIIGHTFSGWGDVPATMPAEDLALVGEYIVNKYNLTYKIDGEVAFHAEVDYNTPVPHFDPLEEDGKTFSGWGVIPELMPARDLEFNGSMISNVYTLTFRIGGNIISSDRIAYGSEIVAPEAPAREGYTFTGWQGVPATMPAKDVLIDGDYEINKYKVTYMLEGEEFLTQEYEYGAPIVVPADPVEEGSSFSGWGDVPATMPAFDLVFGGTFADNFYRVIFRIDGAVIYTDDFVFGAPLTAPDAPEKEGYTFNGWGEIPTTMPASNLEFEGSYTVNTYVLSFKIGDDVIYSGTLAYGSEISAPEAPAKEGYSFGGWGIVPTHMPASDLEITGEYTQNNYTLTYRIGEEDIFITQLPYGSEITAPEAPAKEGHTFAGWSGIPAVMPANDLVIAGSYTVNNYVLSFRIGDEVIYTGEIPYGMEITAPEAPAKEGYTFTGWGMVPATMPAADLEVLGSYEGNVYNLTYRIDGEDFFTTQIGYGSEIPAFEAPAKEGYSFLGWSDAVATMPANDLVINGTYSLNSYNVVFKIGDEVIFEGLLPYGTEILIPDAPAKEGHTFSGWGMVPSTMPASDLEFNGAYDVNVYTLTFDIDGEVFFVTRLAYGTEITAPAEVPDKEGKAFAGWGNVPATMPANDLVISGTYSSNSYTLTFKIGEEIIFTGQQPFGSEIVVPEAPVKEGYTFSGWGEVPATVPAKDLEFIGEYVVNQYKLQFLVDGEVIATDLVNFGDPVVAPEIPVKEGHSFTGWGIVPATMPASDLAISGSFERNYYSVTFKAGEDVVYTAQLLFGDRIEAPEAPAREGYSFEEWNGLTETMPAEDKVFEASYKINSYNLTFRIGEEIVYSGLLEYSAPIEAPETPAKEGFTFTGWGMVPATMPASNLEITGNYEVNFYNVIFKNGEEVIESIQVAYGSAVTAPAAPEKEGYTFAGWGEIPTSMPASDLEFNASYTVNSYTLTFKIGDEVIYSAQVEYGAEIVVPDAPAKEGYTFAGWGIVPVTMPAADLELTGAYDVTFYNIIFKINDEVVFSAQLAYGSEIIAPEVPEKEGFVFSGWSEYPSTMPAHDVEVNGTVHEEGTVSVIGVNAGEYITVYTIDGVLIYNNVKASDMKERLTPGIYIVNGKKTIIR